jgi:Flp pilus assembly protein TadG
MRRQNFLYKKGKGSFGQSMVEFALVLPILLVLVFGLIEAGRLLFIYGSVTTASRQAVRYGSATGDNGSGTLKYLDCAGIQAAAEQMGFILPINNVDIIYTRGGTTFADCDTADSAFPDPSTGLFQNGDRIEVTTTSAYTPIVPIVPFGNFDITTESKRTIFIGIAIDIDPITAGQLPDITLAAPADQTYSAAGETISFTFTITNSGPVDLTGSMVTVSVRRESDGVELDTITCNTGALTQGSNNTCSGSYTTNGTDDVFTGSNLLLVGLATATDGNVSASDSDTSVVTFTEVPALTLNDITASPTAKTSEGPVTFIYDLTNSGNVPLSNFSIIDTGGLTLVNIICDFSPDGLAVGASTGTSCASQYSITTADIAAGSVIHNAQIQAEYNGTSSAPVTGSVTVYTQPLGLAFSTAVPSPYIGVGDLEYTYLLTNYSGTQMDNPILTIDLARLDGTSPSPASVTLDCGASITTTLYCAGTYAIEQTDLDAGGIIFRNATASATQGTETLTSNTLPDLTIYADEEVDFSVSTTLKADGVTINTGDTVADTTTEIEYTYSIENSGNISIPAGTTYEIKEDGVVVCAKILNTALAPNTTTGTTDQCIRTHPVSADDLAAGSLISSVIGYIDSIAWGGSTLLPVTSSNTDTATVYTYNGSRLSLEIGATVLGVVVNDGDSLEVGDSIVFTYRLTNTGNTTLTAPYSISGGLGTVSCSSSSNLLPGNSTDCSSSYTIQSGDVGTLANTATGSASGGSVISNADSISFTITSPFSCSLSHSGTINDDTAFPTWTITNDSGIGVTISKITIAWHNTNADRKLKIVRLGGTKIWDSESNSGSVTTTGPWNIGTGNTLLGLEFGQAPGTYVRATANFSDALCSGTTLSSP